jgi:predicted alpha/beta hydrolase family esterase
VHPGSSWSNDDASGCFGRQSLIANLQRTLLGLWLLGILVAMLRLMSDLSDAGAWLLLGLLTLTHAAVLAVEFAWMLASHGDDPTPRPRPAQLLRAWMAECLHAPLVFFWRQPLRHRRWPDPPGSGTAPRRAVLLVHGYVCNRGLWNAWLARLQAQGTPGLAVNLQPPFGDIDAYRPIIDDAVRTLTRLTGRPPLVVAHSMGGLAVRAWWAHAAPDAIHHLVTLGSPHHGTRLARLGVTANARQMREHSRWLQDLAARETPEHRARTTCVHSHCDNIVFPPANALLTGAAHVHLPATPHVAMVDHPQAWAIAEALRADTTAPAR